MIDKLVNDLKKIPKSPGIYKFFNSKGEIIYIGKSVNLKSRVNSYFNGKSKLSFAKQKMVKQIENIETIITNNETESLILETTLIKKHSPKYNILMKDGKNHIYIKITDDFIPKIIKTRFKSQIGTHFGPYISTNYVNNILKLVKKIFGYRSCNINFKNDGNKIKLEAIGNTKIPCMDYYIKRCSGPCLLNQENINIYKEKIEQIKDFLKGNTFKIKQSLELKMKKKAGELKFEEAAKIKESLEALKTLEINQIVREGVNGDFNIINIIEKFNKSFVGLIEIRDSKITGFYNYDIENKLNENKEIILKNYIENLYIEENGDKLNYIIPFNIELEKEIRRNIKIEVPKIGTKKELLELCYKNIYEYAYKAHLSSLSTKGFSKQTMISLLEKLGYKSINKKIIFECNDISHITGNHTVASRSVIENGKSANNLYRKFKIKTLKEQEINDFDSMREVMTRRLKEIEKTLSIPDLIIIDGGKGQLSSVVEIVNKEKNNSENEDYKKLLEKLQLVGLAKKEEELFLPGKSKSILLDKNTNELRLVQKIRDEAHRFAITFNRDSRIKSMKKNILEELPGFGPKTRQKIIKTYGNIDKLESINKEELSKILNKNQIETLENHGII